MKIKKFLVQIQSDETTRWASTDARIALAIQFELEPFLKGLTDGPIPAVTVTTEEQPSIIPIRHVNPTL